MRNSRPLIAAISVAGSITLAVTLGYLGGLAGRAHRAVPVAADTYVASWSPSAAEGHADYLAAGGHAGGAAISYLKFHVDLDRGARPTRAELWLARHSGPLPALVELSVVPATGWDEEHLTAGTAPRLGTVVGSIAPRGYESALRFDVTKVIQKSGWYAFAVTAPTPDAIARFVARDDTSAAQAPTLTLSFDPSPGAPVRAPDAVPGELVASGGPSVPAAAPWPVPAATPAMTLPALPEPSQSSGPAAGTSPPVVAAPVVPPGAAQPSADSAAGAGHVGSSPSSGWVAAPASAEAACRVGSALVPDCGVLWGVAPAGHTTVSRTDAIKGFEAKTGRQQALLHTYHRGEQLFPTAEEISLARNGGSPRLLFLNWKPYTTSWAGVANGKMDGYLDRLAGYIRRTFPERFFFTMNHEPEDDVVDRPGSGMTARDFAAAFRHVVLRLRAHGVTNMVTAVCYMAYVPWNTKPWFEQLYPGDDVIDWVSWDAYAYSDPGYGHGDFAEMVNRRSATHPSWPGFYNWAAAKFPDKPLMLAEWGVWYSADNPGHQAVFYDSVARQIELFPRIKAMMYFDTPSQEQGRDSRVDRTAAGLRAYRRLGTSPIFAVMPEANRPG